MTIYIKDQEVPFTLTREPTKLRMPTCLGGSSSVFIKQAPSGVYNDTENQYWANAQNNNEYYGVSSYLYAWTATSGTQELVNIEGEGGILTHIISPVLLSIGHTCKVTIVADGVTTIFNHVSPLSSSRFLIGGYLHGRRPYTNASAYGNTLAGGFQDEGFEGYSSTAIFTMTPLQAISEGIGLQYKNSLKVTLESTGNSTATCFNYSSVKILRQKATF